MSDACIYTLEPVAYGGVPDKLHFAHDVVQKLGFQPRLIYSTANRVPSGTRFDKLAYFLRARPFAETIFGMKGFGIPDYPLPSWMSYFIPLLMAQHIIRASQMHFAVSGSSHVGLPSALIGQPFILWIGTLYEDEIIGKAKGGDAWAMSMMQKPIARKILAWEERFVFRRSSLILTNGEHTADAVKQFCPEVAHKVRVLIFPIDEKRFKPALELHTQASNPYLLFAARINEPRKNTPLLIRAFAQVRQHYPTLRLVLTGDPPNNILHDAAQEANVIDAIDFMGYQTPNQLVRLYQEAELFIVPSLQEGMCNAMLEALACGTPVIATRCGGPEKVIRDGEFGYLVDNNDKNALAKAIITSLADRDHLDRMRKQARSFAVRTYARPIAERILRQAVADVYPYHFTQFPVEAAE